MNKVKFTVSSDGSGILPIGRYVVRILGYEEIESSNGTPGLKWRFQVAEGELEGRKATEYTYMSEAAQWRVENLLRAAGVELPDPGEDFVLMPKDVEGKVLEISVNHREYEGKTRMEVKEFAPVAQEDPLPDVPAKSKSDSKKSKKSKSKKKTGLGVGDKATFDDGDDTYECVIQSIAGDVYTVLDEDGDEWELEKSDLTAL